MENKLKVHFYMKTETTMVKCTWCVLAGVQQTSRCVWRYGNDLYTGDGDMYRDPTCVQGRCWLALLHHCTWEKVRSMVSVRHRFSLRLHLTTTWQPPPSDRPQFHLNKLLVAH